jgi:predicted PurR-regulated permease PerM
MEIFNFAFLTIFFAFAILVLVAFLIAFYFLYKMNKKVNEMNQDVSEALTNLVKYLDKEFKLNNQAHQDTINWQYNIFEKIIDFENQNFSTIFNQNNNLSASFNIIMELLGYRAKFDENQIEKPQVNYSQPPAPQKLEGLRINDRDQPK